MDPAARNARVVHVLTQLFDDGVALTIDQLLARLEVPATIAESPRSPPPHVPLYAECNDVGRPVARSSVAQARRRRDSGHARDARRDRIDMAVLVESEDEYEQLGALVEFGNDLSDDKGGGSYLPFDAGGAAGSYRAVAQLVGEPGILAAHGPAIRMLGRWNPAVAVKIGVAASLHNEIKLGDIVAATQIDAYDAIWQLADGPKGLTVRHHGTTFHCYPSLLRRIAVARFHHKKEFAALQGDCSADRDVVIAPGVQSNLQPSRTLSVYRGHVASGNVISDAAEFARLLRTRDADLIALDTSSAALAAAAEAQQPPVPVLALHGISEILGRRLRKVERGALRRYAMRNAVRYLLWLARLGVLPRHPAGPGR